jgi:hypothetical protein
VTNPSVLLFHTFCEQRYCIIRLGCGVDLRNIVQTKVVSFLSSGPRMVGYWAVFSEIFGRVGCT